MDNFLADHLLLSDARMEHWLLRYSQDSSNGSAGGSGVVMLVGWVKVPQKLQHRVSSSVTCTPPGDGRPRDGRDRLLRDLVVRVRPNTGASRRRALVPFGVFVLGGPSAPCSAPAGREGYLPSVTAQGKAWRPRSCARASRPLTQVNAAAGNQLTAVLPRLAPKL